MSQECNHGSIFKFTEGCVICINVIFEEQLRLADELEKAAAKISKMNPCNCIYEDKFFEAHCSLCDLRVSVKAYESARGNNPIKEKPTYNDYKECPNCGLSWGHGAVKCEAKYDPRGKR